MNDELDVDPYRTKTVELGQAFEQGHPLLQHITIFDAKNVYRPDPHQVLELASALGTTSLELALCFKPERLAYQFTAAYLFTNTHVRSGEHLSEKTDVVYKGYVEPHFSDMFNGADNLRAINERAVRSRFEELEDEYGNDLQRLLPLARSADQSDPAGATDLAYFLILRSTMQQERRYTPGLYNQGETFESAVVKIATDSVTTSIHNLELSQGLRSVFNEAERAGIFEPITLFEHGEGKAATVLAGPGSGKTTIVPRFSKYVETHGGNSPDDWLQYNNDILIPVLENPASLSETMLVHRKEMVIDEVSIVAHRIANIISGLIDSGKKPFIISETSQADFADADFMFVVHVPIDVALNRVAERVNPKNNYSSRGLLVDTELMLKNHKEISEGFPHFLLEKARGGGKNTVFEILDNDVSIDEEPLTIAFGSTGDRVMNIYDIRKMLEFSQKKHLKDSFEGDVHPVPDFFVDESVIDLAANSDDISLCSTIYQINFADRKTGEIYATSVPNQGLEIYNAELFAVRMDDRLHRAVFEAIDQRIKGDYSAQIMSGQSKQIVRDDGLLGR